ncbi:MAG: ATP-binding protein [Candidatus Jordarchaeum sp.]|uniref:ATP-binding protein n=1 Tax=Candidatus Jordarchaeum sp. TaxID=2823881 RepID=UPI004049BA4D
MSGSEEELRMYFTDFDGKFKARLGRVIAASETSSEEFGTSSPYTFRVLAEYDRDLMRLIDSGMLLAVRNFKTREAGEIRYTLMGILRFWPEHFGLRGLKDYQYYPLQFEVIEQSVGDWETSDKSTMVIQISAIPINYDLVIGENEEFTYERGFSYPVIGDRVYILNKEMIKDMYNRRILEELDSSSEETSNNAWKDPRLGIIKMFEASAEDIPIYVDYDSLVRYHFGIFAFTGGGKSNMLSNILRRLLIHTKEVKVIIFDISCEYPFLLMDLFANEKIPSKIILENKADSVREFYNSIVKPKLFEDNPKVIKGMEKIFAQNKVTHFVREVIRIPTFSEFLDSVAALKSDNQSKPNYLEALNEIEVLTARHMAAKGYLESDEIDKEFAEALANAAPQIATAYNVHEKSTLYGWFTSRQRMVRYFREIEELQSGEGLNSEAIKELIEGETQLISISISDPQIIKGLVIDLTQEVLAQRKREFKVKPYILFVWDEAQEFAANPGSVSGIDRQCSIEVERLLRQGRKYGLGGCIATQRIAHLNTSALQQLHTYFVSTLPRPYDRGLISNTFMIDKNILEKTLEFTPGDWLLSSYIATGLANVPIYIRADNAEEEIEKFLNKI